MIEPSRELQEEVINELVNKLLYIYVTSGIMGVEFVIETIGESLLNNKSIIAGARLKNALKDINTKCQ